MRMRIARRMARAWRRRRSADLRRKAMGGRRPDGAAGSPESGPLLAACPGRHAIHGRAVSEEADSLPAACERPADRTLRACRVRQAHGGASACAVGSGGSPTAARLPPPCAGRRRTRPAHGRRRPPRPPAAAILAMDGTTAPAGPQGRGPLRRPCPAAYAGRAAGRSRCTRAARGSCPRLAHACAVGPPSGLDRNRP